MNAELLIPHDSHTAKCYSLILLLLLLPFKMLKFSWFTGHTKSSCELCLAHGPALVLPVLNSFFIIECLAIGQYRNAKKCSVPDVF